MSHNHFLLMQSFLYFFCNGQRFVLLKWCSCQNCPHQQPGWSRVVSCESGVIASHVLLSRHSKTLPSTHHHTNILIKIVRVENGWFGESFRGFGFDVGFRGQILDLILEKVSFLYFICLSVCLCWTKKSNIEDFLIKFPEYKEFWKDLKLNQSMKQISHFKSTFEHQIKSWLIEESHLENQYLPSNYRLIWEKSSEFALVHMTSSLLTLSVHKFVLHYFHPRC